MQGGPRRPGEGPMQPRSEVRRPDGMGSTETVTEIPAPEGFEVRNGDVLVIAYPEVTLPLKVQFAMLRVGGISYTRQLQEGDDVNDQYQRIYTWLCSSVERDIARKAKAYIAELEGMKRTGAKQ